MKRFLLILLALLCMALPALAEGEIFDEAGLISAADEASLEKSARELRAAYDIDIRMAFVNSIGSKPINLYAADFFEAQGYGVGENQDGILFLLTIGERKYTIVTHGVAIRLFNDSDIDDLLDSINPDMRDGDYAGAMAVFLRGVKARLAQNDDFIVSGNDDAVTYPHESAASLSMAGYAFRRANSLFPIVLIVALIVALIIIFVLKYQMKTVRRQPGATSYVRDHSFALSRTQDIYLYTTTTRRKIETESSSGRGGHSGGSSSTFSSSSGGSFGGGGSRSF